MGFQQALSGLNTSSKALDTIGNNISNSNTVGYKSGAIEFADVFAASLSGAGTAPVGLGARVAAVAQQFTQGNITVTNNPLDVAINGGGFFQVDDGSGGTNYTRSGKFNLDKDGYIVNAQGLQLKGIMAVNGNVSSGGSLVPLRLFDPSQSLSGAPQRTGGSVGASGVQANVNLDSRVAVPVTATFNYADPTSYNQSTAVTIYDSIGNPHTYSTYFVKTAANTWDVYATVTNPAGATPAFSTSPGSAAAVVAATTAAAVPAATGGDVATAVTTAVTAAPAIPDISSVDTAASNAALSPGATAASVLAATVAAASAAPQTKSGTLTFNSSGQLTSGPMAITLTDSELGYTGAITAATTFNLDFSGSTQFGSSFAVNTMLQDGYAAGTLAGFKVGSDGTILGNFTNGQSQVIGQAMLASFRNPQGLQPLGNNVWGQTPDSGAAIPGSPGSSGQFGVLQSAALEDSNVDLTAELVNMITQQRVYQANAQTIKTQDTIMQTLVNL